MLQLLIAILGMIPTVGEDPEEDRLPVSLSETPAADTLRYSLRLSPVYRWMSGSLKVRELLVTGTRLDLRKDVGLDQAAGGNLQFDVESPSVVFVLELEELFGFGGHSSSQDFAWNGTTYTAPSQVRAHASMLTLRTGVAFKAVTDAQTGNWVGPYVGLEWPYYTVSIGTNRQHGSIEEWQHYLPYPVIGAAGSLDLGGSVSLQGRMSVGYLPSVPTPFFEGGRLYVAARPSVYVELPLVWHAASSVDLSLALTYQYWSGNDHSNEDDNRWTLSSPGVLAGVAVRW
jgi:hypothetical protein